MRDTLSKKSTVSGGNEIETVIYFSVKLPNVQIDDSRTLRVKTKFGRKSFRIKEYAQNKTVRNF